MNLMIQQFKSPKQCLRFICRVRLIEHQVSQVFQTSSFTNDALDAFTRELIRRHRFRLRCNPIEVSNTPIRYFMDTENPQKDISNMTTEELDEILLQYMTKNRDVKLLELLKDCTKYRKRMSVNTLKKLLLNYSTAGKPDIVDVLRQYSATVDPYLHRLNGEYSHYLAKAHCMKGNSEKGLALLKNCYESNVKMQGYYRIIFRELIQDSVQNRSEASLVIFKKYVLIFSKEFGDHYPLVCLWHLFWSSSWFSDQMASNDLMEQSGKLQEILRCRATAFSITILRESYNEDAVIRLLQTLLQYKMMDEYGKVLEVLFSYKLKNRDIRGCTEIIKNSETLGIPLSSSHQRRYITLLIQDKPEPESKPTKGSSINFKLKF